MKAINITVDPDGNIKIEGEGFKGKECDKKMEAFEKELGTVKKRTNKSDYYQVTTTTTAQTKV